MKLLRQVPVLLVAAMTHIAVTSSAGAAPADSAAVPIDLSEPVVIDRVIAIVNDRVITSLHVANRAAMLIDQNPKADRKKVALHALNSLLEEALFGEAFLRLGTKITERNIDSALAEIKRGNNLADDVFIQELKKQGYTLETYRRNLAWQLARMQVIRAMVQPRVHISDDMMRAAYKTMTEGLNPKDAKPFDELKPALERRLFNQEIAKETELWLQDFRKQIYMDIRL